MFEKEKKPELVGASAKLAAAERMRETTRTGMLEQNKGVDVTASQAWPLTVIYALCVILAMILTDKNALGFLGGHLTGIPELDQMMLGSGSQIFFGEPDVDHFILIILRGFGVFFVAGIIPFGASLVGRVIGRERTNPYVACMGVAVALPLVIWLFKGFILPKIG